MGVIKDILRTMDYGPSPESSEHVRAWLDEHRSGFGHFINTASTAGLITKPTMSVYSGTKFAVRAISEGLRQEAGEKLRVTIITPGFVRTNLANSMTNQDVKAQIVDTMDKLAISPDAIARAIAFAIEQPADVDVGEIVVRPTAQA